MRPLAPPGFHDEISIACNLLSLDQRGACDPEVLSVNAASMALALSTLPWDGAVGAVRVGLVGEEVVLNPTRRELKASKVNLVVVATSLGKCTMLEGEASRVPPEDFLRCVNRGLEAGAEVARKVEEVFIRKTLEVHFGLHIINFVFSWVGVRGRLRGMENSLQLFHQNSRLM